MDIRCTCAEQRASESAAHIDRLNVRVDALRRQWREQMDVSDTWRVRAEEARRLRDQERAEKAQMITALDESMAREDAMREVVKSQKALLAAAQDAVDTAASCVRDRDRQIAELRQRIVENAEYARAVRIGVAA